MVEVKEILSFEINTNIYDFELSEKIFERVKNTKFDINPKMYYKINISFDCESYDDEKLRLFNIKKGSYIKDSRQELVNGMLGSQLEDIQNKIAELGIDIGNAKISGDNLNNTNIIAFTLSEDEPKEYNKKGELKRKLKASVISPDTPATIKRMAEVFKDIILNHIQEDMKKEKELKEYVPNMVNVHDLMSAISEGITMDKKYNIKKKREIEEIFTKKLISNYKIDFSNPLELSGDLNFDNYSETKNNVEVDCPNILIYIQNNNGKWKLKKADNLSAAERIITKECFNKKEIENVVVINKLKPLSFILMEKTYDGLVMVDKKNAINCDKLQVCWN